MELRALLACTLLFFVSAKLDCSLEHYDAVTLAPGVSFRQIANLEEGKITMELIYKGHAWVGLGPSKTGRMVVSDAVIGIPEEGNKDTELPSIGKYRMTTEATSGSGVKLLPEMHQTLQDGNITQNATHTVLRFSKLLKEDGELEIPKRLESTWIYAIGLGNAYPSMHSHHGAFTIIPYPCIEIEVANVGTEVIGTGTVPPKIQEPPEKPSPVVLLDVSDSKLRALWITHGVLIAIAWSILAPLSIGAALLRKTSRAKRFHVEQWWFPAHRNMNVVVVLFTTAGIVIAFVAKHQNKFVGEKAAHFQAKHSTTGLVMYGLMVLQACIAFFRPPKKSVSKSIKMDNYSDSVRPTCDSPDIIISEFNTGAPRAQETGELQEKCDEEVGMEIQMPPGKAHYLSCNSWPRLCWDISHRFLGVGVLAMAWYNCHEGIQDYIIKYGPADDLALLFWGTTGGVAGIIFFLTFIIR